MTESFAEILRHCLVKGYGNPRGSMWTHENFAEEIGLESPNMIGRYINAGRLPDLARISLICKVLMPEEATAEETAANAEQRNWVRKLREAWEREILERLRSRGQQGSNSPELPDEHQFMADIGGVLLDDFKKAHEELKKLSIELKATEAMVTAALVVLGENDVPPEERPKRLLEIILLQKETIRSLRSEVRGVDPDLDRLTESAAYAIEAGQLVEADSHLAELEEREEDLKLEEQLLAAANTKAERGPDCLERIALSRCGKAFRWCSRKSPSIVSRNLLGLLGPSSLGLFSSRRRIWRKRVGRGSRPALSTNPGSQAA